VTTKTKWVLRPEVQKIECLEFLMNSDPILYTIEMKKPGTRGRGKIIRRFYIPPREGPESKWYVHWCSHIRVPEGQEITIRWSRKPDHPAHLFIAYSSDRESPPTHVHIRTDA
jgi:hypothetical protein